MEKNIEDGIETITYRGYRKLVDPKTFIKALPSQTLGLSAHVTCLRGEKAKVLKA